MSLYPHSRERIKEVIVNKYQNAVVPKRLDCIDLVSAAKSTAIRRSVAGHILWMLEEVGTMPEEKSGKAGRWMGWIYACLETWGFITNIDSRDMARVDAHNHND
ncbi:MAG: hypothetical protein HZA35_01650 [Parcubacteria group bacterium]|nr:hypothetical protein [Parcubacteria group bacterium]